MVSRCGKANWKTKHPYGFPSELEIIGLYYLEGFDIIYNAKRPKFPNYSCPRDSTFHNLTQLFMMTVKLYSP